MRFVSARDKLDLIGLMLLCVTGLLTGAPAWGTGTILQRGKLIKATP